MVNPMDINYNLTNLSSINPIDSPADWLSFWNNSLNGVGIFVLLGITGIVLFLAARKFVDSDTEAISYSGFILTFAGLLLFIIKDSYGNALLGWGYLAIIMIITAISTFLNFVNRRF